MNYHNPVSKCAADQGIVPLSREENEDLYQQLWKAPKDDKEPIIQTMIEGNMALIFGRVSDFLDDYPRFNYLRDDIISECFVGLTRAVRGLASMEPPPEPNPLGFIYIVLRHAIIDFVFGDSTIPVPNNTQWYYRNTTGENLQLPKIVSLDDLGLDVIDTNSYQTDLCLQQLNNSCCTQKDFAIIWLRLCGYNCEQIGDQLGMARTSVIAARQRLYRRFQLECADQPTGV